MYTKLNEHIPVNMRPDPSESVRKSESNRGSASDSKPLQESPVKQPIGLDQLVDPSDLPRLQNDPQIEMQDEGYPEVPLNAGESSDPDQELYKFN